MQISGRRRLVGKVGNLNLSHSAKKLYEASSSKKLFLKNTVNPVRKSDKFFRVSDVPDKLKGLKTIVVDTFNEDMHGELVATIAKGTNGFVRVKKVDCPDYKLDEFAGLAAPLDKALNIIKRDKSIKAVNMSMGYEILIKKLAKITGLPLTRSNVGSYRQKVRDIIVNLDDFFVQKKQEFKRVAKGTREAKRIKNQMQDIKKLLKAGVHVENRKIESITERGVKFYKSAGNEGSGFIDVYSFANGVTNVGALSKKGKKALYSVNNSLVSRYSLGDYEIKLFKSKDKGIMFHINEINSGGICPDNYLSKNPAFEYLKKTDERIPSSLFVSEKHVNKLIEMVDTLNEHIKAKSEKVLEIAELDEKLDDECEKLGSKLMPVNVFAKVNSLSKSEVKEINQFGNFISTDGDFIFNVDKENKLIGAASIMQGTSFAAPKVMHDDVSKAYINENFGPMLERIAKKFTPVSSSIMWRQRAGFDIEMPDLNAIKQKNYPFARK